MKIVFRDLRTMIHTGRDMGAHEARSVPGAHSRRFPGEHVPRENPVGPANVRAQQVRAADCLTRSKGFAL